MAINIITATINDKTYTSFEDYNITINLESLVNVFELLVSVPEDEIINKGDRREVLCILPVKSTKFSNQNVRN